MKYQGEELVPVRSIDEVKPGMMVVYGPCEACEKMHAFYPRPSSPLFYCRACDCPCWADETGHRAAGICPYAVISKRRLYRLQEPPAEANDYDVVAVPTKAKEGVR